MSFFYLLYSFFFIISLRSFETWPKPRFSMSWNSWFARVSGVPKYVVAFCCCVNWINIALLFREPRNFHKKKVYCALWWQKSHWNHHIQHFNVSTILRWNRFFAVFVFGLFTIVTNFSLNDPSMMIFPNEF